jgi:hypothetical protein
MQYARTASSLSADVTCHLVRTALVPHLQPPLVLHPASPAVPLSPAMAAVFSFGSFGDIIATAQLAYQLAEILSDSAGSSMEYQELILELDALASALRGLDDIVDKHAILQSVKNSIQHSLRCCRNLMNVFLDRIKAYKPALRKGGSGNSWRDNWRKVGWHLFRKEEIVELRMKLVEQKATINMMLSMSHWCVHPLDV